MPGMANGITTDFAWTAEDEATLGEKCLPLRKDGWVFRVIDVHLVGDPIHVIKIGGCHLPPFHRTTSRPATMHSTRSVWRYAREFPEEWQAFVEQRKQRFRVRRPRLGLEVTGGVRADLRAGIAERGLRTGTPEIEH